MRTRCGHVWPDFRRVRRSAAASVDWLGISGEPGIASTRVEQREVQAQSEELTEALYEDYTPQRLEIPGAKPHPGPLVQSAALASVLPPKPTYQPKLSNALIASGKLSLAQLEAVVSAGQAHAQMLLAGEGESECRRGFFIGDGTGVGKGREIGGIILDNMNQGRIKPKRVVNP